MKPQASRTNRAQRAAIYRDYAKSVEESGQSSLAYAMPFHMFDRWWGTSYTFRDGILALANSDYVVTSLCFMAAMVEAGDA